MKYHSVFKLFSKVFIWHLGCKIISKVIIKILATQGGCRGITTVVRKDGELMDNMYYISRITIIYDEILNNMSRVTVECNREFQEAFDKNARFATWDTELKGFSIPCFNEEIPKIIEKINEIYKS